MANRQKPCECLETTPSFFSRSPVNQHNGAGLNLQRVLIHHRRRAFEQRNQRRLLADGQPGVTIPTSEIDLAPRATQDNLVLNNTYATPRRRGRAQMEQTHAHYADLRNAAGGAVMTSIFTQHQVRFRSTFRLDIMQVISQAILDQASQVRCSVRVSNPGFWSLSSRPGFEISIGRF